MKKKWYRLFNCFSIFQRGPIVEKLTEETLRDWVHLKELLSFCEGKRNLHNFLDTSWFTALHFLLYSCSTETGRRDIPQWQEFSISPNYQTGACAFPLACLEHCVVYILLTFVIGIVTLQTIESSAREFMGKSSSTTLAASVVCLTF